ncbi:HAMP domain-containing sensor histidine kinase [Streptomyces sp. FIT100]|uniref:sensor histidine kinase n=1 Tax=Streptomyces sp. FIT100 TaxID=2837956 RepID=UPI0021C79A02|nr:HAMP domain-containing sensor histidine kinase [Streptomyces sp. FIT100]UUN27569.1 HAMP domain-containing histidine kinase [Streptomyces sp. FIT100]
MKRKLASVRARTTIAATAVVTAALVAAGIAVLLVLRSNLTGEADRLADEAARQVAVQIAAGAPYGELRLPDGEDNPVQVVDRDGRLLAATPGLTRISGTGVPGVTPVPPPPSDRDDDSDADDPRAGQVGKDVWHGAGSATVDGETHPYRFARIEATDPRDETVLVYAGAPLDAGEDALHAAGAAMLTGLPVLLAVVAGSTWRVTRRALRPVEAIRAEMAAITASQDLSRRVPQPDSHDEVARLARTTNDTLAALEQSVLRQRRFVADASHELRSPIASLRTQLEVGAAHPHLLDIEGAVADTVRLQQLAADLLLLARLEAGERLRVTPVDLSALVRTELSRRTGDRHPVHAHIEDGVEVLGSRGHLARVVGNLVDNAQRHTRTAVTVSVRGNGTRAVVEVADDGDGVPESERERIFQPFVRLDEARSRDDGGAGLGLALARDIAVRHGGTVTVHTADPNGALFALRLPAPAQGPGERPA